jgi:hypothetical protein
MYVRYLSRNEDTRYVVRVSGFYFLLNLFLRLVDRMAMPDFVEIFRGTIQGVPDPTDIDCRPGAVRDLFVDSPFMDLQIANCAGCLVHFVK